MDEIEFLRHIRKLVVIALFSDDELMERLVLKGGNLLDLVYNISTRSSLDVDFSIDGDFADTADFKSRVEETLSKTFREHGYVVFDVKITNVPPRISDNLKNFWGGYKGEFKLITAKRFAEMQADREALRRHAAAVGKRGSTRFSIDFSKHEFCGDKQSMRLDDYTIYGQSPPMFVCEKLRAICQQMEEYRNDIGGHGRARARDFLDIFVVASHFDLNVDDEGFQAILRTTFDAKRVPLRLLGKMEAVREQHRDDFVSVQQTVKANYDLKEYDFYFDFIADICRSLESLWNE